MKGNEKVLVPENTRFLFNEETAQVEVFQPAVIGRALDVESSVRAIQQKIVQGDHNIPLEFVFTPPAVTDQATAEELGIRDLVSEQTTYFYGSDAARIQNISASAARFNGLLVAPGETFSAAKALGDISLDNGYAEAWIIYGDQTIKSVGGGVCQVSTTLFRTVFFGGYPIVERYPHAYRVSYYEQNAQGKNNSNLAGLDATVFVPVVDFKFTNDSPNWLLMETDVNQAGRYITWRFYSTSDGRTVEWDTTGPTNIVPEPEPVYKENPELDKGEIEQVDWGVAGADVTVTRTVYKGGSVYLDDTIKTQYRPWRDVFEYGPGTEGIPEQTDEDGDTTPDQ
jgi:vancomycin resistance protein YoaR